MTTRRLLVAGLVVLGLLGLAAAIVYFAEPAKSLPSVLPGHISGSTVHRDRRGVAALVIGLGLLVLAAAVMATGTRRRPTV
jgi:hypothetical protein